MRILFLTPQLPYPPHQGAALRNFNLIKNLARDHEIHILSFGDPAQDPGPLIRYCATIRVIPFPRRRSVERMVTTFLSRHADMELRLRSVDFRRRLESLLQKEGFDIIQAEGLEMAQYLSLAPRRGRPVPVFDDHNAEYVLQRRAWELDRHSPFRWPSAIYSLIQWQKLARYERQVCQRAGAVVAVSEADRRALEALAPGLSVTVVPNGIDPDYFYPYPERVQKACGTRLVFTGTLDYRPNVDALVWFCREVLSRVARREPEVKLYIVGQRPHRRVQALAGERVVITGWVPDVRPYLARSAVYVVPLRIGGGTRFKLLEAMASGVPVVSTRLGAEGIAVVDGEDVLLADSASDFAERVLELLRSPERAARLARRARERVVAEYDWRLLVPRLREVYERVLDSTSPHSHG